MRNVFNKLHRYLILISLAISFFAPVHHVSASSRQDEVNPEQVAHIFFSRGCADCWPYVEDVLLPTLQSQGLATQFEIHDYTVPEERSLLAEISHEVGLPRSIADSMYAFVPVPQGTLVLLGHNPPGLLSELSSIDLPERLVVWQPLMHSEPTEYRLWAWSGSVQAFPIDTSLSVSLPDTVIAGGPLPAGMEDVPGDRSSWMSGIGLLPMVITAGLLDSVNPCAFAVILLLLAFLFTLRHSRKYILKLGLVYIGMIFLVYFAIGIGLFQAIRISKDPHIVARAGSWLLIALGTINLFEYLFPKFPIKLHMPKIAGERTNQLIKKATLPATIGAGLLVGLCTFPCSGGIYVSIITMLNAKATIGWGLSYLGLYNLLFVLPLLGILLAAGNRRTVKTWARWERTNAKRIRLWYGLAMIVLGLIMILAVI
ncbi:MAG: cytochrome c biogenesis protein CcdA [Brevefilum sp.]|nr:cytochrome c biogenesis protein CcdA [Brevefilum sp.]